MTSAETTLDAVETVADAPRRSRGFIIGMTAALLGLGGTASFVGLSYSRTLPDSTKIAPGVSVGTVPVGGLTREEALEKTRSWARERLTDAITLVAPVTEKKWAVTTGELGGRFDLDTALDAAWQIGKDDNFFERLYHGNKERDLVITPDFKLDTTKLDAHLAKIAKAVRKPAKNATAKMDAKGALVLAEREQKGIELNLEATKAALLKNGMGALADGEKAELIVKEEEPKVTGDDLGKMGSLLAAFTTDYGGSPGNRKANVGLAASKINGTLLGPGEIFSYNGCVGPRETELGWKMAHQYQDGLVVDGVGGGVCQVSTTLYNTVLLADLKIVARSNHSMPVAYVRPGRDATVAYDSTDFKFQNSTDGPIFVGAKANGETLTFRIYGTKPPERKVLSIYTGERRYNASGGSSVTSYRKVQLPDGTTKTEKIDDSSYRAPATPRR